MITLTDKERRGKYAAEEKEDSFKGFVSLSNPPVFMYNETPISRSNQTQIAKSQSFYQVHSKPVKFSFSFTGTSKGNWETN